MVRLCTVLIAFLSMFLLPITHATPRDSDALVSEISNQAAQHTASVYHQAAIDSLAELVTYKTVAKPGLTPTTNPEFIGFKQALARLSQAFGLDYSDHGYVVLIGLGRQQDKVGVITHGDVQPADVEQWQHDPYTLDQHSVPGRLIARGTEDDKGAIVTALYAMKSIKELGIELDKRIELMVYMAEESNWDPLREFLKTFTPADINITIDAKYPVVTAEKGWSKIAFQIPNVLNSAQSITNQKTDSQPLLTYFGGGYISSQVPQQAKAIVLGANQQMISKLKAAAKTQNQMRYRFEASNNQVTIFAEGKATHSSTPQNGVNALTHLAQVLSEFSWPKSQASLTVAFVNDMIGLGLYAEKFGDIAYADSFMGKMTLAPTIIEQTDTASKVNINLRRPRGKSAELLDEQTMKALVQWQNARQVKLQSIETYWGQPLVVEDAPHLSTLLNVFEQYTGITDPQPVSIGGSTNSKLFPNALSFGPAMPGVEYTGHTENEFITVEQLRLNLKMYAAVLVELAGKSKR